MQKEDSAEIRQQKLEKINDNFTKLEAEKNSRMFDIVVTLEQFDGKLSLSDILNTDIPLLTKLKEQKERLVDMQKQRQQQNNKK